MSKQVSTVVSSVECDNIIEDVNKFSRNERLNAYIVRNDSILQNFFYRNKLSSTPLLPIDNSNNFGRSISVCDYIIKNLRIIHVLRYFTSARVFIRSIDLDYKICLLSRVLSFERKLSDKLFSEIVIFIDSYKLLVSSYMDDPSNEDNIYFLLSLTSTSQLFNEFLIQVSMCIPYMQDKYVVHRDTISFIWKLVKKIKSFLSTVMLLSKVIDVVSDQLSILDKLLSEILLIIKIIDHKLVNRSLYEAYSLQNSSIKIISLD